MDMCTAFQNGNLQYRRRVGQSREKMKQKKLKSITVIKELDLEFDLGNMLALDKNPLSIREFRENNKDDFLRSLARDNAQLLLNEMWKLPTERVDEVIVAKLPEATTRLPREKPPPKPRPPTKWEEFAKLKGIQKKNKTNLVWDDVHKEWKRRWGYKRAKDDTKEWLLEVPETADPNEDQFAKRNKAKKERVAKNELNRLRNIARAQKIKVPGVGLAPTGQQSKSDLEKAVHVAKLSTASVGKFQDRLPKEKAPRNTGKKRKFQPLIGDFSTEKQKQLDIFEDYGQQKASTGHQQSSEQTNERRGRRRVWFQKERTGWKEGWKG